MSAYNWGDIQLGRIPLRETFTVAESGGDGRSLDFEGQESYPPLTRAQVIARHDGINALIPGQCIPLTFTDKPERNGYYMVKSAGSTYTEHLGERVTADWKVSLDRVGSDAETDLQSRLTGAVRLNDFALTGERWHAPPIGHYAYYTGSSNATTMTRTGADGTMTVYRGVPADVSPRWGCAPTDYLDGRVKVTTTGGQEVYGVDVPLAATGWALSNGLINATPGASGTLDVQAYTGGAWHSKEWNVSAAGSGASITSWDGATLLRNDPEMCIVRLTKGLNPGRASLDLTLRRGSRFIEGYLQTGTSATLAAYLTTAETNTSFAASGYVTATNDDADGNRFAAGSARTFTAHASGGITKSATTALDFWIGTVTGGSGGGTLNANPGFESGTTGWSGTGGTFTQSSALAKLGTYSGRIVPDGVSTLVFIAADNEPTTPGTTYRASAWLWCASARSIDLNVNWFDSVGSYVDTSTVNASVSASTWTFFDGTVVAPVGATQASILPTMGGTPPASDVMHADEVRLRLPVASGDTATDLRNQYVACMPEAVYGVRR